jgi:hypothetical protein
MRDERVLEKEFIDSMVKSFCNNYLCTYENKVYKLNLDQPTSNGKLGYGCERAKRNQLKIN